MAMLSWDATGSHRYENGVDRGVIYKKDAQGDFTVPAVWNGLTGVDISPEGGDTNDVYADNMKYLSIVGTENVKFTIKAYTYPDEFASCDGSLDITTGDTASGVTVTQQSREIFGFSCRTKIGTDQSSEAGYKIHLFYNCLASPSDVSYETVNDSPDAQEFSWEVSTTPVAVANRAATAHIIIDSTKVAAAKLTSIENALYGTDGSGSGTGTTGYLPTPAELLTLLA